MLCVLCMYIEISDHKTRCVNSQFACVDWAVNIINIYLGCIH